MSEENRRIISGYIQAKLHTPGIVPANYLSSITTDMDHFPYSRYYRGMTTCEKPRVFDREAGRRQWRVEPIDVESLKKMAQPRDFQGCFQIPCSTILPCVVQETTFKRPMNICVNVPP